MLAVIPYRPAVHLNYYPVISILIVVICVVLHIRVDQNIKDISASALAVCADIKHRKFKIAIKSVYGEYSKQACAHFFVQAYTYPKPSIIINEYVETSKKLSIYSVENSKKFVKKYLTKGYRAFEKSHPPEYLRNEYVYVGGSWDVTRMVSSSFAHANWEHLIGNILGYLAFGLLVELIIGPVLFIALFIMTSLGVGIASSIWYADSSIPNVFLGLSGILFGMMGTLVYVWPNARIKALLWVVIFFKRISLSAWLLAVFYIAWNIHYLTQQADSNINFIAHLIGALIGFVFGICLLKSKKEDLKHMIQ